jgi:hypothetical protein
MSRRKWFFGILIATFLLDIVDTQIKGADYMATLGQGYWVRLAVYGVASAIAIRVANQRYQLAFAVLALVYEIGWALRLYDTLV